MANTLGQLSKQLRELATTLPQRVNKVRNYVVRTINFDLLQTTPVDTGTAVSNWQIGLDEAATEPRPAFVPTAEGYMKQTNGEREWTHRADTEATRQANIEPALQLANQTIDSSTPEQVIHITNPLSYIKSIDEGHSAQAQFFVDRAIILGQKTVSRAKITD